MTVFFDLTDYDRYRKLLRQQSARYGLSILAYCLMPNHVHMIAIPSTKAGLSRPIGNAHRKYAKEINARQGWTGHLWQERFASFPMTEPHLLAATRYVLLNPVRAGLVANPQSWPFSSARAHLGQANDPLVDLNCLNNRIANWTAFLQDLDRPQDLKSLRNHSGTGRPLADEAWITDLETKLGRRLRPGRPGPKTAESR